MKKLAIGCAIFLSVLAGGQAQQGAVPYEVLPDPGLESGNGLVDWQLRRARDVNTIAAVAEAAHSGQFGLRITDDAADKGSDILSAWVAVSPGKKYEVSFWYRTVNGDGVVEIGVRFQDENGKLLNAKKQGMALKPGGDWKQYSFKVTAPAEMAAAMALSIHSVNAGIVTADFDDFSITEVPAEPSASPTPST